MLPAASEGMQKRPQESSKNCEGSIRGLIINQIKPTGACFSQFHTTTLFGFWTSGNEPFSSSPQLNNPGDDVSNLLEFIFTFL